MDFLGFLWVWELFRKYSGNYPETFPGIFQDVSGHAQEISRKFPGNFPEISWKFPTHFPDVSRKFPGHVPDISQKLPGNFRICPRLFRKFPRCLTDISRKFPGNVLEMSRKFLGNFPDLSFSFATNFLILGPCITFKVFKIPPKKNEQIKENLYMYYLITPCKGP